MQNLSGGTRFKCYPGPFSSVSYNYEVNEDGLILKNEADYASFVESKGFEVAGSAAIRTEKRLKDRFER